MFSGSRHSLQPTNLNIHHYGHHEVSQLDLTARNFNEVQSVTTYLPRSSVGKGWTAGVPFRAEARCLFTPQSPDRLWGYPAF
jgi:hypothetical protein